MQNDSKYKKNLGIHACTFKCAAKDVTLLKTDWERQRNAKINGL